VVPKFWASPDGCPVAQFMHGHSPIPWHEWGYWALGRAMPEFGTTVHLVDAGVDTGGVLKQARGISKRATHRQLCAAQAAFSREICVEAVENALAGKLERPTPACRPGNGITRRSGSTSGRAFRRVW